MYKCICVFVWVYRVHVHLRTDTNTQMHMYSIHRMCVFVWVDRGIEHQHHLRRHICVLVCVDGASGILGIFVYWCVWMEQHQHHLYICMFTCCVCEHIDVSIHVAQHRHDLNSILVKCTSKVATTPVEIRGNSTSRHHQKVPRLYIYIYI